MFNFQTNLLFLIITIFGSILMVTSVSAQGSYNFASSSGLAHTSQQAGYDISDQSQTPEAYVSRIIAIILSILGVIFLGLTIYGGIVWMTAQGNQEKVSKAKELITEAIIGLIIVIAAYAITYFVLKLTSGSLLQ